MISTRLSLEAARQRLAAALGLDDSQDPFPWQARLLEHLGTGAGIPRSLDIPTGLGKTASIAIWLLARAVHAPVPRRLVYVVDRRAVVDQAPRVAESLREWVTSDPEVASSLDLADRNLPISTLRGQFVDNREWLDDPTLPAIIVGTVDMVGSRLLFEGYGTSRKMRPFHAGLLGCDSLFVLDEAHLTPPFEALLDAVTTVPNAYAPAGEAERSLIPPSRLLALSATGRAHGGEIFDLDAKDTRHPVVRQRLQATKKIEIVELEESSLAEALVKKTWARASEEAGGARYLIFTTKRDDAEKIAAGLTKLASPDRVELLTGARRIRERTDAARRLEDLGYLAGSAVRGDQPVFLVATSAGEVGVDLDADHMLCDLVEWERMIQRLGRVNRRGQGEAGVTVFAEDPGSAGPEGETYQAQRSTIEALPSLDGGLLDGSPGGIRELMTAARSSDELRNRITRATSPVPLRPELDRATLDAWSMTSLAEHPGRPEVEPWLRGWIDRRPQTRLVWRASVPTMAPASGLQAELERYFAAAPPHSSEVLETETWQVSQWLAKRVKKLAKVTPGQEQDLPIAFLLNSAGELTQHLSLGQLAARARQQLERSLAGATLVVSAEMAGLQRGLLDPKNDAAPPTADGDDWMTDDSGAPVTGFRVREVAGDEPAIVDDNWRERERFPLELRGEDVIRWLVIEKWRGDAATEEDRSASRPQLLDEHQSWAAGRASTIAERLQLPTHLAQILTLAARLHDEGKRAIRWQRAMSAPDDGIYAKTRGPVAPSLLDGYRHELGSLLYLEADPELRALPQDEQDLVRHLVASHHGHARPFIRTDGCEGAPPSALQARARAVALRFFELQRRWGPWGLAWLECLLRAADQQASRDNDARDRKESR